MVAFRISAYSSLSKGHIPFNSIREEIGTYILTNMVTRLIMYVYHVLHFVLVLFAQPKG